MNGPGHSQQTNSEDINPSHIAAQNQSPHWRKTDALVGLVLFGEYAVLDLLGQGGMAKVYKAKQLSVDRFVALKTLTNPDPDVAARFANEVKIHGRLHHKNIVQAYDCLIDPETQQSFFVMEYLSGLSVEEMIKRKGPIASERDFITVASQICDALEHAHQKGVIHRDLKPGNIILQEADGELLVKVVDFGIAKVQEDMQRFTKTGLVVGSPVYMSPEQCMGKELDTRADVYSLGTLFYEMLTGKAPYCKGGLMDVMRAHCDPARFPDPVALAGATIRGDNQIDSILKTSLQTEPSLRFQSIADFRDALNFWFRSVESAQTDRAVPLRTGAQAQPAEKPRTNQDSQLRDLVAEKQIAHDPTRARFDETVFCTAIGKGTGEKMRLTSAQFRMSDSLIGSILFNRYKILDLLGEGGMSVVYRALDNTTQQVVAIKTLKYHDSDLSARFAREVEIHDELKHPNIVKAIECLEAPSGQSFFVMEYLKGVVLQDYIGHQGSITEVSDICAILSQVLNAIEFAHDEGILHRDIKPDNIILVEQRGQLRVKVLDFGLAKIQEDLQRLTKTGVVVGSPAYMSPEQCQGKALDYPSDIYSLAVVAYEVITGKLPYDAETDVEIMKAHCDPNSAPTPIAVHRKDLKGLDVLEQVFQKALHKDASKRYQGVEELKQGLDQWWRAANSDPDAISPFKSTRRKKRAALKKTEVVSTKKTEKEAQALNELMTGHRKAQQETYRSHFKAKETPIDTKKFLFPVAAVLFIAIAIGGAWGLSIWVEKFLESQAAQQANQPVSKPVETQSASQSSSTEAADKAAASSQSVSPESEKETESEAETATNEKENSTNAPETPALLKKLLSMPKPATSEIPVDESSTPLTGQEQSAPTSRGGGVIRGPNRFGR